MEGERSSEQPPSTGERSPIQANTRLPFCLFQLLLLACSRQPSLTVAQRGRWGRMTEEETTHATGGGWVPPIEPRRHGSAEEPPSRPGVTRAVPLQRFPGLVLQLRRRRGIALRYSQTLRLLSAWNRFAFFLGGSSLLAFPPRSVTLLRAAK